MDIYQQLRRDESSRNFPYVDTTGNTTIGVGRNLSTVGLFDNEIEALLTNDVARAIQVLTTRLPYFTELDPVRQGVLINMCFNLGFAGLEGFPKMLAAVAHGDWATASSEMLNSTWAKQVGDRANRLAQQIVSGQWV